LGALFIGLALFCTLKSGLRGPSLSWQHLPIFLLYFLYRLTVGGIDVAKRTLSPTPAIKPAWVSYPLQSSAPHVQLALSAIVGLLPGTLAARIDNNSMKVHLLDSGQDWRHDITVLEQHLMRLLSAKEKPA
jgi:multicomponent Na+:H+ antiporter subunit E